MVEDEPLIAIDIADRFSSLGARVLSATNLRDGVRLAEHPDLSAAVLDFGLHNDDSAALCARLQERGIPFVIYSGYPPEEIPCEEGAYVPKPNLDVLVTTVAGLIPCRYQTD